MSKPKIDRDEAPEGYRAYRFNGRKGYLCPDCAFFNTKVCVKGICSACARADACEVIFKKKEPKNDCP